MAAIVAISDDDEPQAKSGAGENSQVEAAPVGAPDSGSDASGSGTSDSAGGDDSPAEPPKPRTYRVVSVTDGDTLRLASGDNVRLVGMDAPETGRCGSERAAQMLTELALGERVTLPAPVGDRDRYDRLLRYVDVGSVDAALRMIQSGLAVARYDSRDGYDHHPRQQRYIRADRASANVKCAAAPKPAPLVQSQDNNCASGYDPCIPSYPPDLDCADVDGPIYVTGSDPHGLDADNDGVACEW